MSASSYARVLDEATKLSPEEQRLLVGVLTAKLEQAKDNGAARPRWEDYAGSAPYPLCSEDAQEWVTRTRRESDEVRVVR
ncbi:hypothetical protein LLH23_07950 [bacterium]|nr:hypothetical protein [bacterium]